jgi:major vault protein
VAIYVPPSYAVLVSARSRREVVKGPQTRILDFDEELEVLELSTGKPKADENVLRTAFLQTDGNKVSDVVRVKTSDHVELEVALSYRVSFLAGEGESRWFNVKNYVALLCDHLGSIVRAAVRATPVDAFHAEGMSVIRNAVLGEKSGDGKRTGRKFEENGMWVYDVEILEVRILDADVKGLLANAQRAAIISEVARKQEGLRLADERLREEVNRQIHAARQETLGTEVTLEEAKKAVALAKARTTIESERLTQNGRALAEAESLSILAEARSSARERDAVLEREALEAEVAAFQKRMGALAPELIATLKTLGNQQLTGELVKHASPLAILGGDSVAAVVERLLQALPIGGGDGGIAKVLPMLEPRGGGK